MHPKLFSATDSVGRRTGAILLLAVILTLPAAWFAWRQGEGQAASISGLESKVVTQVAKPGSFTRQLSGLLGASVTIQPDLDTGKLVLPSPGPSALKQLQDLGQQADLQVFYDENTWESDIRKGVHLLPGGIVVGAGNHDLEARIPGLAAKQVEARAMAVRDLADLGDRRSDAVLRMMLENDPAPEVRGAAAYGLAETTSPDSRQTLVKALGDNDEWVRDQARIAIFQNGPLLMEPLLRTAMKSGGETVALEAADILEQSFGLTVAPEFWAGFAR